MLCYVVMLCYSIYLSIYLYTLLQWKPRSFFNMQKRSTIYTDASLWKEFGEICFREDKSRSEKLTEFITRYVQIHKRGNPQTLLFTLDMPKHKCCWSGCEKQCSPNEMVRVKFISGLIGYLCQECFERLTKETCVIAKVYKRRE